ncbi:MAG TPA: hypothetical protein VFI23_04070 [Rhizomicrobium sp.]|nr:hypothetical protein [Rhizomicrobium sp.]
MKIAIPVLAGVLVVLAGPALAGHSSAKEREVTRQLNLEQARMAQASNQGSAQFATANQAQSAPAVAPAAPVESAPVASPAGNAGENQEPAPPAQ